MDLDTGTHRDGEPGAVSIAADGSRVAYLCSGRLRVLDVRSGEDRLVVDGGVDQYAIDATCQVAGYVSGGRLHRVAVDDGTVTEYRGAGHVRAVRPDPTGRRLAYLTAGTLRVIDETGAGDLLAGEEPGTDDRRTVRWGEPSEPEISGMTSGYWWSPDGERLLATRIDHTVTGAPTSLHLLDLDGFWVDVRWDRHAYPHLVAVTWEPPGGPLITVMPRSQHHALILAVDARTGETQVHAELDDPRWVDVTPGTPAYLPDGRVVLGGELTLDPVDTRCLFADGTLLTPPHLQVRRLAARIPGPAEHLVDLIVEAGDGEPSEQHVYRVRLAAKAGSPEVTRLTTQPGWHTGYAAGGTLVIASETLEHGGTRLAVHSTAGLRHVTPAATGDGPAPRPVLGRVTDRRLSYGVLYPHDHVAGRRLPVVVDLTPPGGHGVAAARTAWLHRQRYADAGFAVVVVDTRGTRGVSPSFEKAVYRRVADIMLADQTEALKVLAAKHPDLDLDRVAVRGTGVAGSIAVAGLIRYPDVFRAGVASFPAVDWSQLPTGYAERYLGSPEDNPEAYARHDLAAEAPELSRPLLLVYPAREPDAAHAARFAGAVPPGAPLRLLATIASTDVTEPELAFIREVIG
ncbi:MAG: prolyl oligopeptidase family serine peptidase [Micromonosporaceae bacterium]